MARLKRSSPAADKADRRLAGVKSIGESVRLGDSLSVQAYATSIKTVRDRLEAYNSALSTVDAAQQALESAEKDLTEISKKILSAVALNYGDNSTEYTMVGGVRMSDRKKTTKKVNVTRNELVKA
jgi:hypothetical protein